jgi:hypothetical protein
MSVPVMYRNQQANPQTATGAAPVQYEVSGKPLIVKPSSPNE